MHGPATPPEGSPRYQLEKRLGAGAFGEVYRATDALTGAPVAVKLLALRTPEALFRFKQEFRSLADLAHPNLVRLHSLTRQHDEWMLAMDLVRGASHFAAWVAGVDSANSADPTATWSTVTQAPNAMQLQASPSPTPRATVRHTIAPLRLRSALRQLVSGVAELHRAGLLHRDLKPSNVLVDLLGRVSVLDFGLVATDSGSAGFAGTPAYVAPEVAAGHPALRASDWYAVGVMLYEVLAGHRPFPGDAAQMLMQKQIHEPPALSVDAGLQDLADLAMALLVRDPARRPDIKGIRACLDLAVESVWHSPIDPALLVDRDAELTALRTAFSVARRGRLATVLVGGDPGMGKSALVDQFLGQVQQTASETVLLRGRCYEHDRVPFKALDGVVDALTTVLRTFSEAQMQAILPRDIALLVRIFPVLARVRAIAAIHAQQRPSTGDDRNRQRRGFAAFRELLARLAAIRPVVVFIDDLHWGDSDSLALWETLVRPPDAPALLLLATYRPQEVEQSPLLRGILNHEVLAPPLLLRLAPLSAAAAAQVARRALDHPDESRARAVAELSRGIPFFIAQLAATWHADDARPPTLAEALHRRVAGLNVEARMLLDVLAIATAPLLPAVASAAAHLGSAAADTAMATLRTRALVQTTSGRFTTYHDLIRESLVADLDPEHARALHLQLARHLATIDTPDAEALTHHFNCGGDGPQTVYWSLIAAEKAAASLAFDRATELYRLAVEQEPRQLPDPHARALRVRLASTLESAGHLADAARLLVECAADAPELERLELMRRAAEDLLVAGYLDEGQALLEDVMAALRISRPFSNVRAFLSLMTQRLRFLMRRPRLPAPTTPTARTRLQLRTRWSAAVGLMLAKPLAYGAMGHAGFRQALALGEPQIADDTLSIIGTVEGMLGSRLRSGFERRIARWRALLGGADHQTPLRMQNDAINTLWSGRFTEALVAARTARACIRGDEPSVTWLRNTARILECNANMYIGDAGAILKDTPDWMADCRDRGDFLAEAYFRIMWNSFRTAQTGDAETGRRVIDELIASRTARTGLLEDYWEFVAQVNIGIVAGDDPRGTLDFVDRHWPVVKKSGVLSLRFTAVEAYWVRGTVLVQYAAQLPASSARAALIRRIRADAVRCARKDAHWGHALAHGMRSSCFIMEGDHDAALAELEEAERNARKAGMQGQIHAYQLQRGQLIGGDAGQALINIGRDRLIRLGWRDPDTIVRMSLCPVRT